MRGFELVEASSLEQAVALLDTEDPTIRPFSGGTALMLMMKTGVFEPTQLVSLRSIESRYHEIEPTAEGGLRLGAMATLSAVERSPDVIRVAPVISRAMKRLANVRVRNVARIGGNLAHGDPHMDLPPIVCALRGEIWAVGPQGTRAIPVEALFAGYYETVLGRGELIADITIPSQEGWASAYLKCTTRTADDWPTLGVAVSLRTSGGVIADARVVVSAATEKLTRVVAAEEELRGADADLAAFARAGDAAAAVETIDDARGSAFYKNELVRVYVRRALQEAANAGRLQ